MFRNHESSGCSWEKTERTKVEPSNSPLETLGTCLFFKGHPDMLLLARLLMGHPQGMAQLVHDHARILAIWVWPKVADPYCGTVGGFLAEAQEILQIMLRQFAMVHGRTVCIVGTAGF